MFFSIIIPTYNRLGILEKCLRALESQTYEQPITEYEVIVVDDGSTDDTVPWLKANATEFPHLQLWPQSHHGPAAARNLGVEVARGNFIIFIDSDLVVTDNFLQAHANTLIKYGKKSNINTRFDHICFK